MSAEVGRERLERYSLTGPENQAAVDAGLAGGAWFRSAVPRKRMKELMRRSDYPAVRDTIIWLGLILTFGGLGSALWIVWHSWWAVPFFAAPTASCTAPPPIPAGTSPGTARRSRPAGSPRPCTRSPRS